MGLRGVGFMAVESQAAGQLDNRQQKQIPGERVFDHVFVVEVPMLPTRRVVPPNVALSRRWLVWFSIIGLFRYV